MNANEVSSGSEPAQLAKGCLSVEEIEKTVSLLRVVWPNCGFITWQYLHWLYCENPAGAAEVCNVWDNGQIIAHYAAIPIVAKLFGRQERGLLSLNTAVHPLHRGKGYFKTLATRTFDDAHARGVNFVVGVANANSTVLFRKQLRFQLVSPLTAKIGLGAINRSLTPREEQLEYVRSWDEQTLSWRLKRPGAKYNMRDKSGFISVLGHTGRYGIWATMIDRDLGQTVVSQKTYFRWNPLALWIGLDARCDWGSSRYVNLPERLKPSPLNLVFKDLSGLGRTLDPQKILFSLLDFDAY